MAAHYKDEEDVEAEESIYDESKREDLVEDDEMTPEEEGFMRGYEEADEKEDEVDAEEDVKEE